MPRPQQFDSQEVLDQAMNLFWRQGYHATSIRDLLHTTGLKPGSLYATFGGKRQLFQQALKRYYEISLEQVCEHLHSGKPAIIRIKNVFHRLLKRCQEDIEGRGCLMSNTILELSCLDTELSQQANNMFNDIESEFTVAIKEAQNNKTIDPSRDPKAIARYLIMSIHGIRVYSKGNLDSSRLQSMVDDILNSVQISTGK